MRHMTLLFLFFFSFTQTNANDHYGSLTRPDLEAQTNTLNRFFHPATGEVDEEIFYDFYFTGDKIRQAAFRLYFPLVRSAVFARLKALRSQQDTVEKSQVDQFIYDALKGKGKRYGMYAVFTGAFAGVNFCAAWLNTEYLINNPALGSLVNQVMTTVNVGLAFAVMYPLSSWFNKWMVRLSNEVPIDETSQSTENPFKKIWYMANSIFDALSQMGRNIVVDASTLFNVSNNHFATFWTYYLGHKNLKSDDLKNFFADFFLAVFANYKILHPDVPIYEPNVTILAKACFKEYARSFSLEYPDEVLFDEGLKNKMKRRAEEVSYNLDERSLDQFFAHWLKQD